MEKASTVRATTLGLLSSAFLFSAFLFSIGSLENGLQGQEDQARQASIQVDEKYDRFGFSATTKQAILDTSADEFARWAASIVLKTEYGNSESKIRRWRRPPTVQIIGGSDSQRAVALRALREINRVLARTRFGQLKLFDEKTKDVSKRKVANRESSREQEVRPRGEMVIYLATLEELHQVAKALKFEMRSGNEAFFALKWDSESRIRKANVLISTDRFHGDHFDHVVLEEIIQALGPTNDSGKIENSVFYSGRKGPKQLNWRDAAILEVLYSKLKPGSQPAVVRRTYRNHLALLKRRAKVK